MALRKFTAAVMALGVSAVLAAPLASAAPASTPSATSATSATSSTGTRSLAEVLTSDGNTFDRNWYDYDIVTEAVLAVLAAKPDSPVKVLTEGSVPLTAFIPNDRAFHVLLADLTGGWAWTEQQTFTRLAQAVGIDAIEQVLLYHVVAGSTITSAQARAANGTELTTVQGGTLGVRVVNPRIPIVQLRDQDRNDVDGYLNPRALDLNAGNAQIAHGVVFVLRPLDL